MNKIELLQKELAKEGYIVKTADTLISAPKIKTGIWALDYILDGGISQSEGGHRIEFEGAESSGKTTFSLYIIKKYQELEKSCAFIDGERSYDKAYGEQLGVKKDLLICYPDTLEEAGNLLVKLIPQIDLIVIDSLVSLIPQGEAERETEEAQVALQARVNSLITRKIYGSTKQHTPTLIFINQMRKKVGIAFGNPNTTAGGHAIKHMYNTRIEFRAGDAIKNEQKEKIGNVIHLNCIKNKRGKPFRTSTVDFYAIDGTIDNNKSLFYAGIQHGLVEVIGKTYSFNDKKEVGAENCMALLNDKDYKKLEGEFWKKIMK